MPPETPIHRLPLDPIAPYTTPRAWAPLTDEEWTILAGYLARLDCGLSDGRPHRGRPIGDVRARLDAIFRAVTLKGRDGGRGPWSALPPAFGKPDTISRSYRRWALRGLWQKLLEAAADPHSPPALRRLRYVICCAFRRAHGVLGLRAMLLAKRLRLYSALPSPPWMLPDPDLSKTFNSLLRRALATDMSGWSKARHRALLTALTALRRLLARARPKRILEPA